MGLALESARQRAQNNAAQQPSQSTGQSRQNVRAVQQQLNALGYNAGRPDGVMGRGTREAIRQWQADNGRPATGELAGPDRDLLFAPAALEKVPAPSGFASGTIERLRDTDLPYNDYRSGMRDPALKNIDVDTCEAFCAADGQCRAFTYNSQARVCFLKHSAGQATYFRGAISGIKGGGPSGSSLDGTERFAAAPSAEGSRLLGPDELAELQAALSARGYDVGRPDGRLGRRTRAAVADFLADNPGAGSGRIDVDLLLAVTGTAGATPAGFDATVYQAPEAVERQLALIAIARDPERLASDPAVLRMLQRDADRIPDAKATLQAYSKANDIERPGILAAYRDAVTAEAASFVADPANAQLRLRIDATTKLGAFDPAAGLAIEEPYGTLRERKLVYGLPHLGTNLVGILPDLPESYSVPLEDAAAASELLDRVAARSRSGNVRLSAFVTLADFGKDANVSGGSAAGATDLPVTVKLDRLLLVTIAGRDTDLHPGDEQLALLVDTVVQTRGQPADALLVARRLGLPTIADRIALPADSNSGGLSSILSDYRFREALTGFFDLAALGLYPELAQDGIDNAIVLNLMTPVERLRVFGDREGSVYSLGNEFERRRALTTFNEQILPDLVARAPAFPIPVVAIKSARLGDYSFDTSDFPLQYSGETQVVQFATNFDSLRPAQLYASLPDRLAMSEADAEQLVSRLGGRDRPLLVFATFGNLVATPQGEGFSIAFVPEEAGLYTGLDLTERLLAVDVEGLMLTPSLDQAPRRGVTVAGSDQPWVPQYRVPVLDGRPLLVDNQMPGGNGLPAVATVFSLAANPALFERRELTMAIAHQLGFALGDYLNEAGRADLQDGGFNPDYAFWAGADEFAREDTRNRFVADFRDRVAALLPTLPFEFSVLRQARVEPFDLDRGYFPVSQDDRSSLARYSYGRGGEALLDNALFPPALLRMAEAEARSFREVLGAQISPSLDPMVFGDAAMTAPPGTMVLVDTLRVDGFRVEGEDVRILAEPLSRRLYALADLSTPLADLPATAPAITVADPVDIPLPASRFDLLGVTLGMPLEAARAALAERLTGRSYTELLPEATDTGSLSGCGVVQSRMRRELSNVTDPALEATIRDRYQGEMLRAGCPTAENTVLEVAFGFDIAQDDGSNDRIVVFKATQAGDVVGAVAREINNDDLIGAMSRGLVDKYGTDFVSTGYQSDVNRWWVESPSMAVHFDGSSGDECRPVWPELARIPEAYLNRDCGAFVRQLYRQTLLIDTRHLAAHAAVIAARIAAAAAAPRTEPVIEF